MRIESTGVEWVQMAHLCLYELGWCRAFQHQWDAVLPLMARLRDENEWSKAFYAYFNAVSTYNA